MLNRILMLIHGSHTGGKIVSDWCRNSGSVTHLQDAHQGNTSCQGCSIPERTQRHMWFSNRDFPYPRRTGFSTNWAVLLIVTQKQGCYMWSIWLLPKKLSTSQICLQINYRVKINIGVIFIMNLKRTMTQAICLATCCRNKNSSTILKKNVLIINAYQS